MKWIASASAYLAVGFGIFYFHSAWGALIGFHIAIIVSLLIAKPNIPIKILLTNNNIKWIGLSVLLCGSSGVIFYLLWDVFGFANDLAEQVQALGLNETNWLAFIAYFAMVNPFIEEYFWRGYWGSKSKSLHTSDLLYAGFHALVLINKVKIGSILFSVCMLIIAGWFWRQVAREDNGLLAPILGHAAADFAILFTVYKMAT